MNIDVIYMCSSEDMTQIENKSVSLVVTSPPYNIDIRYGNKTAKGTFCNLCMMLSVAIWIISKAVLGKKTEN